jgi:hypothetical protein
VKQSRRQREIEARKAADPIAQVVGRNDIDYGSDDLPAAPRSSVSSVDTVRPYIDRRLHRTWAEFKAEVEALGVTDSDLIGYIDVSYREPITIQRHGGDLSIQS